MRRRMYIYIVLVGTVWRGAYNAVRHGTVVDAGGWLLVRVVGSLVAGSC